MDRGDSGVEYKVYKGEFIKIGLFFNFVFNILVMIFGFGFNIVLVLDCFWKFGVGGMMVYGKWGRGVGIVLVEY